MEDCAAGEKGKQKRVSGLSPYHLETGPGLLQEWGPSLVSRRHQILELGRLRWLEFTGHKTGAEEGAQRDLWGSTEEHLAKC